MLLWRIKSTDIEEQRCVRKHKYTQTVIKGNSVSLNGSKQCLNPIKMSTALNTHRLFRLKRSYIKIQILTLDQMVCSVCTRSYDIINVVIL